MVYIRTLNDTGVELIDSTTLELQKVSYDELYNIVLNGTVVHKLSTMFHTPDNESIYINNVDCIKQYKGFEPLDSFAEYCRRNNKPIYELRLDFDLKIPIEKGHAFIDFSTSLPDILIMHRNNIVHIWYVDKYIKFSAVTTQGIYRDGDTVYVDDFYTIEGETTRVALPLKDFPAETTCSRSEFQRKLLFR